MPVQVRPGTIHIVYKKLIENNDGLDSYIDIAEIVQDLLSVKFYILIAIL